MDMYSLDIYDEGQSLGFWRKIGIDGPEYYVDGQIRAKSVSDMVTKVLAATEGQRRKIDVYLSGAGGVNYQSVGAGATRDPSGDRSLQVNGDGELNTAGKVWLPRLIGRVLGIHLLGIDDGIFETGNKRSFPLLDALATLLTGVHIYGHFGGGSHLVYFGNRHERQPTLRTTLERQQLRDSLKKLDRK
jgi:hypothetical protein